MSKWKARYQLAGRRDVVVPVLLQVHEEDAVGRPTRCTLHYDEAEIIDVEKSTRRFWVVFMAEKDVKGLLEKVVKN